jgi:heme A synthase
MKRANRFGSYAWGVLAFNIGVILWGAYVRATGSGAGCGSHWPLCNGEVVPIAPRVETIVEFTHRLSSGLAFLLVVGLALWAFRSYPRRDPVRLGASLSLGFMVVEALIGAGLVLFGLVADNTSAYRAISISIHLVNTFLLLASLTLTAWWASRGRSIPPKSLQLPVWVFFLAFLGVLVIGVTGAITALGDTLFPAASLSEGLRQDLSPAAHFLIRLRLLHPVIAVLVGLFLIIAARLTMAGSVAPMTTTLARALTALVILQLGVGAVNVILLAPVWMQLFHLLLADLTWIALVLLTAAHRGFPIKVGVDRREVVPSQDTVGSGTSI